MVEPAEDGANSHKFDPRYVCLYCSMITTAKTNRVAHGCLFCVNYYHNTPSMDQSALK